jgi:hypothetical protein
MRSYMMLSSLMILRKELLLLLKASSSKSDAQEIHKVEIAATINATSIGAFSKS